jgi:FKBP12-rapamycin complex-associated protein
LILDGADIIQWINFERCTLAEYYPTLAIINLVRMLHDNALSNLYQQIIEAIMVIFKSLGQRSTLYVNQVIPQMIQITEGCKPDRREFFLTQFGILASIIRHQVSVKIV